MTAKSTVKASGGRHRTLVMFSGGIDSTAALWYVLNNPKEYGQIHVHHVHIQNIEGRWKAEAVAVKAVLAYMREHSTTPFTTSESSINTPHLGGHFLYDAEVIGFMTGYMTSRDPNIRKVIIGATGSDYAAGVSPGVERGKLVHNAFHPEEDNNGINLKEFPLSEKTKEEVYKSIPLELAELTWSCRRPRYIVGKPHECGKCKTCAVELRNIKRPKSRSKTNTY